MFTATLIARPGGLDPALVDALRNAWGGGDAHGSRRTRRRSSRWRRCPATCWDVWQDLQEHGVDLVVQPAEGRRKKMLLADMDSTMIEQECIDELAEEAGRRRPGARDHGARDERRAGFRGRADRARGAADRACPRASSTRCSPTRITLMPGGPGSVATMKAHGAHAALVSGGFTAFTGPVAAALGFDEHRANTLLVEDGKLTGEVAQPILGREAKVQALDEITARLGIAAGGRDRRRRRRQRSRHAGAAPGTGVALHAKPSVAGGSATCASTTAI